MALTTPFARTRRRSRLSRSHDAIGDRWSRSSRSSRRLRLARILAARQRPRRPIHSRGQTLIIFALTFSILVGILGLAIDTVRVYDLYARMQRAAESGALAGVIYMPNYYTANLPYAPGDSAVCRAIAETVKNGFGTACNPETASVTAAAACPTTVSSVEIAVCTDSASHYGLTVYITETMNLAFLSAFGVGPLTITAHATAEYLPPVQLATNNPSGGGAGNWGGLGECQSYTSPPVRIDCDDTLRSFAAHISGPAELKEQGDAFVNCEEGTAYVAAPDPSYASSGGPPYTTYNGYPTNHAQYANAGLNSSHCGAGNPDQQTFSGPATTGTAHPGGYAFYIHMNATASSSNLWIYNAPFNPYSPSDCTNEYPLDSFHFYCNGNTPTVPANYFQGSQYSTKGFQDPNLYMTVTYSIYQIANLGNPTVGTLLGTFTALPYDNMAGNGCGSSQMLQLPSAAYGISTARCRTSQCSFQWCMLPKQPGVTGDVTAPSNPVELTAGNDYRVMVESTSYTQPTNFNLGWGQHIFNLKICPDGTSSGNIQYCDDPNNPQGQIGGWSATSVMFVNTIEYNCEICIGNNYPLGQAEFPLGIVPVEYAGLTLDIKFFNPGNVAPSVQTLGDVGITVIPPVAGTGDPCSIQPSQLNGYSYSYPAWERSTTANQIDSNSPALPMLLATKSGDKIYAGLWTDLYIKLPQNYTPGQWTICTWATARQQSLDDPYSQHIMTIKVTALGQSPVHLVS